jgi:hypothetical protein
MVDSTPGAAVLTNTAQVTFTLVPLTNDVSEIPISMTTPTDPIDATASTFQITGPAGSETSNYTPANYETFPKVKLDSNNKTYPLFKIPASTATGITATYAVTCANYAGVIIKETGKLIFGPVTNGPDDYPVTVTGTIAPTSGAVPANGIFNLTIATPLTGILNGLTKLSIEVPVCAIDTTNDFPSTWYIRGGLSQQSLDEGIAANNVGSLGGAVLIGVGTIASAGITIITPPIVP